MHVDDLNNIGNTTDITIACNHLMTELEMNDLGKQLLCLGLQLENLPSRILVYMRAYI